MTANKKSLIKATLLGLLGGGALSSLYALKATKDVNDASADSEKNKITVPLSKKNYLKAVGLGKENDTVGGDVAVKDVSMMSPQDIAALKRSILRKNAEENAPVSIKNKVSPVSTVNGFRKTSGTASAQLRDEKGRFSTESSIDKKAGVIDDAGGLIGDAAGFTGGLLAGSAAIKMLADRILINKKKAQVEKSRRAYVDLLNKEVSDVDEPYYTKKAQDRSVTGNVLGLLGLTGISTAGIAGIVMYKIMENRRKQLESMADKDLSKYPAEKSINFKFAEKRPENGFFG